MRIVLKKGLDIPLSGQPKGSLQSLHKPSQIALNLEPFEDIRFKLLVKAGDRVTIGQPLLESKNIPGQFFVSPAAGTVSEIRRGIKRRLLDIIVQVSDKETFYNHPPLNGERAAREDLLECLMRGGIFPFIRMRPFDLIANPKLLPRDIFVKAVESSPYVPSAEMQVEGHEEDFQTGLNVLAKLTSGKVHLVHGEGSSCSAFAQAENVEKHSISGPHPSGNSSVHIHAISPIRNPEDVVWTIGIPGVIAVGKMISKGHYHYERIVSIAGNGVLEGKTGFFKGRMGLPISALIADRIPQGLIRFISGDPLMGIKVEPNDFLGFYHSSLCIIPENVSREAFHFFKLGTNKYSSYRAYLTGHISPPEEGYNFTTNLHGEPRPFIDGSVYDRVMPMRVPTVQLVKAVLAEDFELAELLGLLEVASEDFALPAFICPSKIEMVDIIKDGLRRYSKEMGH